MSSEFNYKLEYSRTRKDVDKFSKFHCRKSPYLKIKYHLAWFGTPFFIIILILILDVIGYNVDYGWVFKFILFYSIIWIIAFPLAISFIINLLINSNPSRYAVGDFFSLIIHIEGVIIETKGHDITLLWNDIKYIFKDRDIYIYTKEKSNIIIPRRLFSNDAEFDVFFQNIKSAHTARGNE